MAQTRKNSWATWIHIGESSRTPKIISRVGIRAPSSHRKAIGQAAEYMGRCSSCDRSKDGQPSTKSVRVPESTTLPSTQEKIMVNTVQSCSGSGKPGRKINEKIYCQGCSIGFTLTLIKTIQTRHKKFDPGTKFPKHIRYDRKPVERP